MPICLLALTNWLAFKLIKLCPSTITSPDVGFSNRFTQRMSVLFPAPEEPITPKTFPCGINSDTLDKAVI